MGPSIIATIPRVGFVASIACERRNRSAIPLVSDTRSFASVTVATEKSRDHRPVDVMPKMLERQDLRRDSAVRAASGAVAGCRRQNISDRTGREQASALVPPSMLAAPA